MFSRELKSEIPLNPPLKKGEIPEIPPGFSPEKGEVPESSLIASETVSAKQAQWRREGYGKEEIQELTAKLARLGALRDELQALLQKGDEFLLSHPEEREKIPQIRQELEKISSWRQSLRETLAQRKQTEAEEKAKEEAAKRRAEIEARRARGEILSTFSETTPEGKEITLDLEAELRASQKFYQTHALPEFANALPKEINLSPDQEVRLRETMKQGFDRAMILPAAKVQAKTGLSKLKTVLADKELPGLSEPDQYTASYLDKTIQNQSQTKEGKPKEKRQKAYLLLYQSGSLPPETRGMKFGAAEEFFKEKGWDGLTLEEYYLLQRLEAEKNKDHSFDSWSNDPQKSQWTWLLDSRLPSGCVYARWYPEFRQVKAYWNGPGNSNSNLGARPAVVVPLL
jgi:hypothetical protein